ncbi:hypothetical protein SAMN05661008_00342 [Alkalithermobacter thermoalcaliphilus JW-YL-7 = DSM 7308]|uniref:Uncharacterized protein n=1 Tax=Alkalithermobacter thermoalcaliphilus JW-YL-7 = DSM 7308 TaxID=1121328 RepID=A0A150FPC0_CLOPD|nr:hypothetical protein JWYL7_0547 [[Clostridium] paradoxum JW-YL-7 = DSM 7308]SHK50387.1 hypothetical protein SAMN05661008_00342 [[Clostridium] paradoxum JW-YL-7 = DSM 7308]
MIKIDEYKVIENISRETTIIKINEDTIDRVKAGDYGLLSITKEREPILVEKAMCDLSDIDLDIIFAPDIIFSFKKEEDIDNFIKKLYELKEKLKPVL